MLIPLFLLIFNEISCSPPEARLLNDILSGYVKEERPVLDSNKPVDVTLGVIMQNIINMNEKEEQLEVNAWLKYSWTDENLRWDPTEYENVTDLRHPAGSIWQPDILLYNSVDSAFDSTYKVNILGYSDGSITWMPPGIFKISCKLDVTYFPFDTQLCFFKFGSWTFNSQQINLKDGDFDFSEYMENGEWIVTKYWANTTSSKYDCCPEIYQSVYFYLLLQRRTLYYAFNLIMPCLLTMVLVILGFTLRPDTCEKVGLQISVSLAICIFLTIMNEMTPQTSEAVPLLGIFFQSCMVLSVLATCFTVYVQSYHFRNHQNTHRMGFWMRYFLLEWAPYLLRMRIPRRPNTLATLKESWIERKKQKDEESRTAFNYNEGTCKLIAAMGTAMKENFDHLIFQVNAKQNEDKNLRARLMVLDKIYNHVKMIREHDDDESEDKMVAFEWRFAALVVDKLGLLAFSVMLIVTSFSISMKAPYMFA